LPFRSTSGCKNLCSKIDEKKCCSKTPYERFGVISHVSELQLQIPCYHNSLLRKNSKDKQRPRKIREKLKSAQMYECGGTRVKACEGTRVEANRGPENKQKYECVKLGEHPRKLA